MQPEIKNINGIDHLIVAVPIQPPTLSDTKKSYIRVKTGFINTSLTLDGKPLTYTMCAFTALK